MNYVMLLLWHLSCGVVAPPVLAHPVTAQQPSTDTVLTKLPATKMDPNFITMEKFVIAKLFIRPAAVLEFQEALEKLAIQTRKEPACLDYTYYPEPGQAGAFTLIEHYRDVTGLKFHFQQPYLAAFVKKMEGWKSKDLQVYFLASEPDALKGDK